MTRMSIKLRVDVHATSLSSQLVRFLAIWTPEERLVAEMPIGIVGNIAPDKYWTLKDMTIRVNKLGQPGDKKVVHFSIPLFRRMEYVAAAATNFKGPVVQLCYVSSDNTNPPSLEYTATTYYKDI